jgi:VWFA-related protein
MFRATARMLMEPPPGMRDATGSVVEPSVDRQAELEENEKIYAIFREEAVAQDSSQLEIEQQQALKITTGEAFWKMAQLEKQRESMVVLSGKNTKPDSKYEIETASTGLASFKVYVRLVPVSIVVRDNKGHAVGNLKKEDFQLFDNRKRQEIVSFSMDRADEAQVSKATRDVAGDRVAATTNNVAFVFDDLHAAPDDMARAKASAERHLSRLPTRDRAAVFSTSGDVALDFTVDHEKISAALQRLKSHTDASPVDCPPISYYVADAIVNQADSNAMQLAMEDAMDCTFPNSGSRSQQQVGNPNAPRGAISAAAAISPEQAMELQKSRGIVLAKAVEVAAMGRAESDQTLGMLHDVLGRVAGMPGRRTVLLVSPGFLTLTRDEQRGAMYLIQRALDAGVVFSGLDVQGLAALHLASNRSHMNEPSESQVLDSQESTATSGILADLSYGTGGTYFHNNDDFDEGFRRTADVPEYVYILGFSPQRLDGKFHRLKITVDGSTKRTIQARSGYYALKPPSSQ